MFTKAQILAEISRTARENGGVPLGVGRFHAETGIRGTDWLGKHWARWSDAVKEAGLNPNKLQGAFEEGFLLEKLASLVRELGRFPAKAEIQLKSNTDKTFPSHGVFESRWRKAELAGKLAQFCEEREGYEDVRQLCLPLLRETEPEALALEPAELVGEVYLLKSGKYFKIGFSNAAGRRERELQIQLPEKAGLIHRIKTDDPPGIEHYWHRRFADRRRNGEWFELSAQDVSAFKRRKFM